MAPSKIPVFPSPPVLVASFRAHPGPSSLHQAHCQLQMFPPPPPSPYLLLPPNNTIAEETQTSHLFGQAVANLGAFPFGFTAVFQFILSFLTILLFSSGHHCSSPSSFTYLVPLVGYSTDRHQPIIPVLYCSHQREPSSFPVSASSSFLASAAVRRLNNDRVSRPPIHAEISSHLTTVPFRSDSFHFVGAKFVCAPNSLLPTASLLHRTASVCHPILRYRTAPARL
ncbi:hypothetical protein B0T13DRAFT_34510 [Neurospora crassa]|nr:hypothetical protein B0T13DRAFT_34510 [Neurospora crassa]